MKSLSPENWTVKKRCRLCALLSYVIHIIHQVAIQDKFGKNAMLKGMNLMEGGTTIARNGQIGGHKAGDE